MKHAPAIAKHHTCFTRARTHFGKSKTQKGQNLKTLIICVSAHYGNTLKIASAMAKVLKAKVIEPKEARNHNIPEYDLVGFGSGIYFGKPEDSLLKIVDKLPESDKKAFIFSTRGRNSLFQNSYHKHLRQKLIEKNYKVIGEFSCRGFSEHHKIFKLFGGVNKGHPNSKELDKARAFALKVAAAAQ